MGDGFFGRLMPIAAPRLTLVTDHFHDRAFPDGRRARLPDIPARFVESGEPPRYLYPFITHSDPLGPIQTYEVAFQPSLECETLIGSVRLQVLRDSIWSGLEERQLMIVKAAGAERTAVHHYLAGLGPTGRAVIQQVTTRAGAIRPFLEMAQELRIDTLSLRSIAAGKSATIAAELRDWRASHPSTVRFYHLNAGDFAFFRG
jgi:hypothetical protein